jgi:hypothetical protein
MQPRDELLTLLLALGDALHVGIRREEWRKLNLNGSRFIALREFRAAGVPVPNAGGPSLSVERQRLLATLQAEGVLRVHRRQGLKVPLSKLSSAGDVEARRLCGLPGLAAAHSWLTRLCDLSARAVKTEACDAGDFKGAVDEFNLVPPAELTPPALVGIEEMALPALVRGWAECHSDVTGLVSYWPTAAGREAARRPAPPDDNGKHLEACRELYYATFNRRRAALQAEDTAGREIGPLPLRAGGTTFKSKDEILTGI